MWKSDHIYRDEAGGALRGRPLRYVLASLIAAVRPSATNPGGIVTVAQLVRQLEAQGFVFSGRTSKVVSDALRWEVRRGRVERLERGVYRWVGAPRSTRSRIERRVRAVRRWLEWDLVEGRRLAAAMTAEQRRTTPLLGTALRLPAGVSPP